jgi:hypothetical protein
MVNASAKERAEFTAGCFHQAALAEEEWLVRVNKIPATKQFGRILNDFAWRSFNRISKIPA